MIRYEILLPENYNDGSPVPKSDVNLVIREIGNCTVTRGLEGHWNGYYDWMTKVTVDTKKERSFDIDGWKQLFKQEAIYVTKQTIEVIS